VKRQISGLGRRWRTASLAAFLFVAWPAAAGTLHSIYIDPAAMTLQRVLPPPPAPDSEAAQADMQAVEAAVRARTPDDERRITANLPCTLGQFTGVLGPAFTAETMPVTAGLIEHVFQDGELAVLAAKAAIARPRPYTLKPDLATFGHRSASASYPSGHATFGYLVATVLAQLVPHKRQALFAFAASYGANRMIAGTHFPSDLEAGKIAAAVIAEALFHNPRFERDFAQAAAEIAAQESASGR
jgi:hypothetical protein